MKSIGLDVGNGTTCIIVRGEDGTISRKMYASTYGIYEKDKEKAAIARTSDRYGDESQSNVFAINGREYVIGYQDVQAVGSTPVSTYGREERVHLSAYQTMTRLALLDAATTDGQAGVIEVTLGFGVPNEDYREEKLAEFEKWFKEPITGTKNGEQVVIMVNQVEFLSQPIAVLVDAYYDGEGYVQDEAIEVENILVIDSGSGTLDMTEFRGMKLQKQVSEAIGMNDVYQRVIEAIEKREPKIRTDAYNLEHQIRDQDGKREMMYRHGTSSIPISGLYNDAMNDIWTEMVGRIERRYPDRMRFNRVLLAGGTGDAFAERFVRWMPQIQITEEPQLAIARGLCKYVLSLVGATE